MKATIPIAFGLSAGMAAAAYLKFARPRVLNWGATKAEVERSMPGDEILADASLETTRVITIDAPPDCVWPWLVQMGPRPRAGAYTYDWIERLLGIDIQNTNRILDEYQKLEAGEFLNLNDKGQGILVRGVQAERFLVLQWMPAESTWVFGLYPEDGGQRAQNRQAKSLTRVVTRLVSRNRLRGSGPLFQLGMTAFMEPGSLIMERKMLLGIKERAERLCREREGPAPGDASSREAPAPPGRRADQRPIAPD